MAERRNYIALDWVTGEIEETLKQARQSLEDYVEDREDVTKLRFCLTYAHQVHGSLKMVELHGAALLAQEIEALAQALVSQQVPDEDSRLEALMAGLLQLSAYLQRVLSTQQDQPATLLATLNQLRNARGEEILTDAAVFNPDLTVAPVPTGPRSQADIEQGEFNDLIRKLRQMYQTAMVGVVRDQDIAKNFENLLKVMARLHKISHGTMSEPLWTIAHAALQGIAIQAKPATLEVKTVLRQIDGQLKELQDDGRDAFSRQPATALLKSLLYTVAQSNPATELIREVQQTYRLKDALEESRRERASIALPDSEAIQSVIGALGEELTTIQDILDQNARGEVHAGYELDQALPVFHKVINTLSVLGASDALNLMKAQADKVRVMAETGQFDAEALVDVAAHLVTIQEALTRSRSIDDARSLNVAEDQLNQAHRTVVREARNGLEHAKEAIIEFVASQWNRQTLVDVPQLLDQISGGLDMVDLPKAADVIRSSRQYVSNELLAKALVPEWRVLDTLADALTSVEYYLECLSGDSRSELSSILEVAEDSVARLGYPVPGNEHKEIPVLASVVGQAAPEVGSIQNIPQTEAQFSIQDAAHEVDDELIDVFIEEAAEVLSTINDNLPRWQSDYHDRDSLIEIRRAFHTLKGSGRMVGALRVGELAWSIESLLNRIIEGTVLAGREHVQLVMAVVKILPAMIDAYQYRTVAAEQGLAEQFMREADALARATRRTMVEDAGVTPAQGQEPSVSAESVVADADAADLDTPVETVALATETSESEIPGSVSAEAERDVGAEDLDPELVEVFVEEAAEVLDTINSFLPNWQDNLADTNALMEIRRGFHTLKGSGRMVGALRVGELAWSIESMLNRVLEGAQPATTAHFDLVARALALVPDMVSAYESGLVPVAKAEIESVMADAQALTGGGLARVELAAPVTAPTLATVSAEGPESDESDELALLDIFAAEARAHLAIYLGFIEFARREGHPVELTEDLQRALHTLKGSAHMAEVEPIAKVVTPIERLVKEMRGCHLRADAEVVDLLAEGGEFIDQGLKQLATAPHEPLQGTDELVERIHALHDARLATFGHESALGGDAAQQAAALLADGMEKLLHASDLLSSWAEGDISPAQLASLIDDLDMLAKVASQGGYVAVSELSTALASLYRCFSEANSIANTANMLEVVQDAHESLIDMMDMIAAGQAPVAADSIIERLRRVAETGEDLAAIEHVPEIAETANTAGSEAGLDVPVTPAVMPMYDLATELQSLGKALVEADTDTLEIFVEEAAELIEQLDESVHAWQRDRHNSLHGDELKRNLHTLKGGARLANLAVLGDVSHDYEAYLETTDPAAENFFDYLQQHQDRLRTLIEAVLRGDVGEIITTPVAADGVTTVHGGETYEVDESPDAEVIQIFMDEARDQQEAIDNAIHQWRNAPADLAPLEELKRVLHTLKGGARLAGLGQLGNLAHNFETDLINAEITEELGSDEFFARMRHYQDQLSSQLDRLYGTVASEPVPTAHVASIQISEEPGSDLDDFDMPTLPALPNTVISTAAVTATRNFVENYEKELAQKRGPEEVIKVSASLLQNLVNLAGETSISRARVEEQLSELAFSIEEMEATIERQKNQLRRLEIETEAQIMFRMEQVESEGSEGFDPLEMDRYSHFQQLARSLIESASDITDVKDTFSNTVRDMETLLLQQSRINTELQEGLMRSQMVPFSRLVPRLRRIVRQVASELNKQVEFHFDDSEGELDRTVLERMVAPLEHMLRNAVDHGIESIDKRRQAGKGDIGNIALSVRREGGEVLISLTDDGGGIDLDAVRAKAVERRLIDEYTELSDHEVLQFILHAGFSTAKQVTQISGRGVGMDVVHSEIKQLGGSMEIQSVRGQGTQFIVRLPFTVSVNRALMVCIGSDTYAIPLSSIEGIVRVSPYELEAYYQPDAPLFEYAGQSYQLMYMGSLLEQGSRPRLEGQTMPLPVVLVRGSETSMAVQVDRLLGSREIVVKPLGPQFAMVEGLSGATVLGDGSVVVILDLMTMIRAKALHAQALAYQQEHLLEQQELDRNLVVMVVDDSVTVRKVTSRFLERHGLDVVLAKDGVDAMQKLQDMEALPDVMLLDIEMPRMDGFEVASRIRHSERLRSIPIIMITSRTGEKHRDRALSLGVNKYMGKPYQESALLEAIEQLTGKTLVV